MTISTNYITDSIIQLVSRAEGAKSESVLTGVDPTEYAPGNPLRLFIIQAAIMWVTKSR